MSEQADTVAPEAAHIHPPRDVFEPRYKYVELADAIEEKIDKEMERDGRLPGKTRLAERYGVSRSTVTRAIELLIERGRATKLPSNETFAIRR